MRTVIVNHQTVDIEIIEADGSSGDAPTQAELTLVTALDDYLRTHPAFAEAYPGAHLTRVDFNRIVKDTDKGRFYLRYSHPNGDTEFWGHLAERSSLDLERGIAAISIDR